MEIGGLDLLVVGGWEIHRLGRTMRAGKGGEGIMVLAPLERNFLDQSLDSVDLKS